MFFKKEKRIIKVRGLDHKQYQITVNKHTKWEDVISQLVQEGALPPVSEQNRVWLLSNLEEVKNNRKKYEEYVKEYAKTIDTKYNSIKLKDEKGNVVYIPINYALKTMLIPDLKPAYKNTSKD